VVDLGAVTTPMLYYVAATRGAHGCNSGIQVTGSHNPKDYNGFKMVMAGRAIYGDDIQRLRQRIESETYARARAAAPRWTSCRVHRPHRQRRQAGAADEDRGRFGQRHPGCHRAPAILRALGCEVIDLYSKVDGDFPNHHPDPSKPENLADLIKVVQATDAELGMAFDGDGDRLGLVTRGGTSSTPTGNSCCWRATCCRATRAAPSSSTSSAASACRWSSARPAACR
jgi:phosphomannomutase